MCFENEDWCWVEREKTPPPLYYRRLYSTTSLFTSILLLSDIPIHDILFNPLSLPHLSQVIHPLTCLPRPFLIQKRSLLLSLSYLPFYLIMGSRIVLKLCESPECSTRPFCITLPLLWNPTFRPWCNPLLQRWSQNRWTFRFCAFHGKPNLRLPSSKLRYYFNCRTPGHSSMPSENPFYPPSLPISILACFTGSVSHFQDTLFPPLVTRVHTLLATLIFHPLFRYLHLGPQP